MKNEHTELLSQMIASYKEKAKMLLQSDADYTEVCYLSKKNKEYGKYDGNYINRSITAITLSPKNFNRKSNDCSSDAVCAMPLG
ncbi:MAG: hypothetical protein CVU91_04185 [Firmicutes bacterium HGW-Firmicutes-16]|nr:MAG: hypothetical protein CVU91_04185 [Firmicutes bacterium HGW-Firmicutes-16]